MWSIKCGSARDHAKYLYLPTLKRIEPGLLLVSGDPSRTKGALPIPVSVRILWVIFFMCSKQQLASLLLRASADF